MMSNDKNVTQLNISSATLLSVAVAENYLTEEERKYIGRWWTLSSITSSTRTICVYSGDGKYFSEGNLNNIHYVRPALEINIKSTDYKIGDVFKIGEYEFKIITNKLAWLYKQDIGRCYYGIRTDLMIANYYGKSYIKQYIDKWFDEEIKPNIN